MTHPPGVWYANGTLFRMIKQPKYFYSSAKELKVPAAAKPAVDTGPVPTASTVGIKALQAIHIPQHVFFALGGLVLTGLVGLATVSIKDIRPALASIPTIVRREQSAVMLSQPEPQGSQGLHFDLQKADARVEIVKSFLERYKSPLQPAEHYAKALVEAADRYGLDYRLLPAIMMQESNLCKNSDPALHNCLGFGIHARGTLGFETYEEGFDRAARELKERYIDIGLTTPEKIMTKYTPSSNGSWAASVNQWIEEMEHNNREKGLANESDADLTQYTSKTL